MLFRSYPIEPFNSEKPPLKIFDWISRVDKNLRGCFIAGSTPLKKLNIDLMDVDLVGFTQVETDGKNSWQWAVSPNPFIFIINYSRDQIQLQFEINPAKSNIIRYPFWDKTLGDVICFRLLRRLQCTLVCVKSLMK